MAVRGTIDNVILEIFAAGVKAKVLQDKLTDENEIHICRAVIAKLSKAYHDIVQGDIDQDLVDYYDIIVQLAKEEEDEKKA